VEPWRVGTSSGSIRSGSGHEGGGTIPTRSHSWASVLGLRPAEGGIRIEPCLPADWPGYGATLRWGPGELRIRVENPDRLGHGPSSVEVDGEPWEEPVIPWPGPGRSRDVRVRISSDGSEPREAAHSTEAGDGENR